jgi:hypothetical protein
VGVPARWVAVGTGVLLGDDRRIGRRWLSAGAPRQSRTTLMLAMTSK